MAGSGKKAIDAALVANAGIAVAKFAGYAITWSGSMLSEDVRLDDRGPVNDRFEVPAGG